MYNSRMGKKWKTKTFLFGLFIGLMAMAAWAADTTDSTTTPPSATPKPHKSHHRKKKKSTTAATPHNGATTSVPGSNSGSAVNKAVVTGITDGLGPNNAGSPNMGSGDHVPGT